MVSYLGKHKKKYEGTLTYKVNKGDYYLELRNYTMLIKNGGDDVSFSLTYPTTAEAVSKISYIAVPLKVGSSITLQAIGTVATGDSVKWSSSDKSVATVNSVGKVTAKKAGTAVITAKLGSTTAKIRIKVTK